MSPCLLKKCFHRHPPFLVGSEIVTLVLRRSYAKFTPSNNTVLPVPMAAYVSPAHLATTLQFDRIEDAARREAPVLEILNAGSATTVKAVKRAFLSLSKQIHPHRGGNFDPVRATSAQVIVARGFEQAERAAEFDSFKNADFTWTNSRDRPGVSAALASRTVCSVMDGEDWRSSRRPAQD